MIVLLQHSCTLSAKSRSFAGTRCRIRAEVLEAEARLKGGVAAPALPAEAWIGVLKSYGWRGTAALVLLSIVLLVVTRHANVALFAPPAAGLAIALMQRLPRRLPPLNFLGTRDLQRVRDETEVLLAYALVYPVLSTAVVYWAFRSPIPALPGLSASGLLSLQIVLLDKTVLLGLASVLFAIWFGHPLRQLGFRRVRSPWRWVGPILPFALVLLGLTTISSDYLRLLTPGLFSLLVLLAVVHAGFSEEAFYRILLQTRLELLLGTRSGIAVSSLLFGLRHLPSRFAFVWVVGARSPLAGLGLALLAILCDQVVTGYLFGYMWMRYRNAWVNMAAHTLFDCIGFLSLLTP